MTGPINAGRRALALLVVVAGLGALPAFAQDVQVKTILAPSGKLKAALYPGTPTSILKDEGDASKGVGFELGRELARRLGVPYEPIVYAKNADVQEAIQKAAADVAFTNASPARAKIMDFGPPYLDIELGYLVGKASPIASLADVDQPGRRIGVAQGSTSQAALSRDLKRATVVVAETIGVATDMLTDGRLDAFATNKATLFEMAEKAPGSKVLDGRWGVERHAMGIPKGRAEGLPFIQKFTTDMKANGFVADAIARAGLRGAVVSPAN